MVVRLWRRPYGRKAVEISNNEGSTYYGFIDGGLSLYNYIRYFGSYMADSYSECIGPMPGETWELIKEDNIRR